MIVSNYSSFGVVGLSAGTRGLRDTAIGDFIVTDSFGAQLPKTVPYTDWDPDVRHRPLILKPGEAQRFEGDVVYGYSLTNEGTYTVKAIARVPATNENPRGMMVIETPPLPITIVPRSQDLPQPKPLYNIPPGMNMEEIQRLTARQLAALDVLAVTHPTKETAVPANGVQKGSKTNSFRPDPRTTPSQAVTPIASEDQAATRRSRNVIYGLIVLSGFIALGLILWRSRRSHP